MAIVVETKLGPRQHRQFFGDSEKTFELTAPMVIELERTTGTGIGALCKRLFSGDFRQLEISETVRCGLIGGGTTPERAAELCETYVSADPIGGSYALSVTILERLWFGDKQGEAT